MSVCDNAVVVGPLGIDYISLYCETGESAWAAVPALLLWVIVLIYVLCHTADNYFSPTLAAICSQLDLSPEVAGVTFLAFGNGAPDVFSSIAATTHGSGNLLVGVGALLGAAMFITTIIVGGVTLSQQGEATPVASAPYLRDMAFFVFSMILLVWCSWRGKTTVWEAMSFLLMYALYVYAVFMVDRMNRGRTEQGKPELLEMSEVLDAFWHSEDVRQDPDGASAGDDYDDADEDDVSSIGSGTALSENGSGVISRGSSFSSRVHHDYFEARDMSDCEGSCSCSVTSADPGGMAPNDAAFMPGALVGQLASGAAVRRTAQLTGLPLTLSAPLVPAAPAGPRGRSRHKRRKHWRHYGAIWNSIYWQQWRVRRQLHRDVASLLSDFDEQPWHLRLLGVLELPLVVARNVTVPPVEADGWSQTYAVLAAALCPLFISAVSGLLFVSFGFVHLYYILIPSCLALSLVVLLTTHRGRPPKAKAYRLCFIVGAFLSCVTWIYIIASEAVCVLEAVGTITAIPGSILGLTVLAWGNSSGDLVTNLAVSRAGYPGMALAGCFGGPLFNILIGLGTPLVILGFKDIPKSVDFALDSATVLTIGFVFLSLVLNIAIVVGTGFTYPKWSALALVGLYAIYIVAELIVNL
jgi:sodium/potassium/calcium exchanger 6